MSGNALMNMNNSVQIIIRLDSDPDSNDGDDPHVGSIASLQGFWCFLIISAILKKNNILIHKYSYAVIYNLQQNEL